MRARPRASSVRNGTPGVKARTRHPACDAVPKSRLALCSHRSCGGWRRSRNKVNVQWLLDRPHNADDDNESIVIAPLEAQVCPSPHPSPRKNGEREPAESAAPLWTNHSSGL
jgi:hypothetical protein